MKKKLINISASLVLLAGVLAFLCAQNYIDITVIAIVYLPLFAVALIFFVIKKYFIGHGVVVGGMLGIICEYIISTSNAGRPNMSGAFANVMIIISCSLIGIVIEVSLAIKENKKLSQQKNDSVETMNKMDL